VSSGEKRLHSLAADLEGAKVRAAGSLHPASPPGRPRVLSAALQARILSSHGGQGGGGARHGPAARCRRAKDVVSETSWAPQRLGISCGLAVLATHTRAAAITSPVVHISHMPRPAQARCAELAAERDALAAAAGVTPERCRAAKAQLFEAAKQCASGARLLPLRPLKACKG